MSPSRNRSWLQLGLLCLAAVSALATSYRNPARKAQGKAELPANLVLIGGPPLLRLVHVQRANLCGASPGKLNVILGLRLGNRGNRPVTVNVALVVGGRVAEHHAHRRHLPGEAVARDGAERAGQERAVHGARGVEHHAEGAAVERAVGEDPARPGDVGRGGAPMTMDPAGSTYSPTRRSWMRL
jgi:hypothetical protein